MVEVEKVEKAKRKENLVLAKVARAILLDEKERVLLGVRAKGDEAGKWALIGGKPNKRESLERAVIREVWEEVGLSFYPERYREIIGSGKDTPDSWLITYFWGYVEPTGINLNPEEIIEAKFFTLEEVGKLDTAFDHWTVICEFFANFSTIREGRQFPPLKLTT